MSDLTPEQRNRAAVHKAMEIIVENEITGVSEWRYNLTDRLTEAALRMRQHSGMGATALAAAADLVAEIEKELKAAKAGQATLRQGERT